jgi:hypothetical protein
MKNCLECGEKNCRSWGQKFCSDVVVTPIITKSTKTVIITCNINNKLRKNYRILSELNTEENQKQPELNSLARVLILITNILNTKTGNTYYFLYDQGYMLLDNDYYMLVKRYLIPHPNFKIWKEVFLLLPLFLF